MANGNRLVLAALLLVATLWGLSASAISDCSASLLDQLLQPREDTTRLHAEERARLERVAVKKALVGQLERGEVTLYEAAAQFRMLNTYPPELVLPHCLVAAARSPEERLCREVLLLAKGESRFRPCLRKLVADLEQQMEEDLSTGTIVLPEQ